MKNSSCLLLLSLLVTASCGVAETTASGQDGKQFKASIDWYSEVDILELGVLSPEGQFYFVKQDGLSCLGFMLSERTVTVDIGNAYGVKWVEGEAVVERLFVAPGEYKIIVSENLEGDVQSNFMSEFPIKIYPGEGAKSNVVGPADCVLGDYNS